MGILRIEVKPLGNGTTQLTLRGRDDAGHILVSTVMSPPNVTLASTVTVALRKMSAVASEVTEEEDFDDKIAK